MTQRNCVLHAWRRSHFELYSSVTSDSLCGVEIFIKRPYACLTFEGYSTVRVKATCSRIRYGSSRNHSSPKDGVEDAKGEEHTNGDENKFITSIIRSIIFHSSNKISCGPL